MHASFVDFVPEKVVAIVVQSGTESSVVLGDDGTSVDDTPGDRVWSGSVAGTPSQYVQVAIAVTVGGVTRDVYTGSVRLGNARTGEVAIEVTTDREGRVVGARRTAASPGRTTHAIEALPSLAASFWAVLVLTLGAIALQLRAAERARGGAPAGSDTPGPDAGEDAGAAG